MRLIGTMIVAAAVTVMAASAQNVVNQRRENQQDRIGQGLQSGQLTAGETANLETKEAAINQEVHTDRTLNGGKLTGQERQIVNGQQNQVSKQIYADKHNSVTRPPATTEVGQRRVNQQQRIANGVSSGKLTAGQTARLEKGEVGINQEVKSDRASNGGKLTAAQRQQVNHQQNVMSGKIYRAKH
ncbi:MAG TPA: hypothetical protein VMH81_18665 [Bryobacteraceae bacterium]|nr:hypothetical protein [Bryobacteraceae bacterium]